LVVGALTRPLGQPAAPAGERRPAVSENPSPRLGIFAPPNTIPATDHNGAGSVSKPARRRFPKEKTMSGQQDPRYHTQRMQVRLQELSDHLREDIERLDEPQLRAMFETAAEVLTGLKKAFSDYEKKNEAAWRGED
jgi:hypothetical protein